MFIGANKCSRCGGGDANCYVCRDIPEVKSPNKHHEKTSEKIPDERAIIAHPAPHDGTANQ